MTLEALSRHLAFAAVMALLSAGVVRTMIRIAVLGNARAGIVGGVILGLGRALGETMAVTMVIGNRPEIAKFAETLFAPAHTMASVIANESPEATSALHLSSLSAIGLTLFIVSLGVSGVARLITRMTKKRFGA